MAEATVLGARGFIGAALVRRLRQSGADVAAVGRGDSLPARLGHVYFCAGLTADFRTRLHDTIDAHVTALNELLRAYALDSLTYLSSTRVYQRTDSGHEDSLLCVDPRDPSDLYNLSKLTGESICLSDRRDTIRVVRLSNVFGVGDESDNFLAAIVREASETGSVLIKSGRNGAKDYIALEDAVEAITLMPTRARSRIVNVAGGLRHSNGEIGDILARLLGAQVRYDETEASAVFPNIDNGRMRHELGVEPTPFARAFSDFAGGLTGAPQ